MAALIAALTKTFDVQLEHDEEEITWDSHGHVRITVSEDGRVLGENNGLQHNSNYSKVAAASEALAAEAAERFSDEAQADTENATTN